MTPDDTSDPDPAGSDPFALVGNEIRAAIVRELGGSDVRGGPPVAFSDLRDRVDVDVRSSQFNYHLGQLVGHFVERTDAGYRIRPEGRVLYQALSAGSFDRRVSESRAAAGFDCHYCEAPVDAVVHEGELRIQCPDCDYRYDVTTVPPGIDAAADLDLDGIARFTHQIHLAFARGVCPTCGRQPTATVLEPEETPFSTDDRRVVSAYLRCQNCDDARYLSIGEAVLADATLRAFCHDHGLDVLTTPLWELEFAATDRTVTVESRDPWRLSLVVALDDERLKLVVDGDLTVLDRNRERIEDA
ncbi:DUF7351 domain-containing protein [Halovivax limisalsi]|uniref:DUF7351 domain-containing protein n=1 Tax=Halovivax limisalsi TaxID=1453760 RepID=UPI001FFD113A|nr:ArsR family transcriptional regulator [Halovivax limisalsi]